jgi:sugar diacid utilization regulator
VVPIVARAEVLGTVWVELCQEALEEEQPLIEQATRVIALELLKERSVTEVELRLRKEFLDELLAERLRSEDELDRRARALDLDLRIPYRLAAVGLWPAGSAAAARGARETLVVSLRAEPWCSFAAEHLGWVVALIDPASARAAERLTGLLEGLSPPVRASAVLASPCARIVDYRASFLACERVLQAFGERTRVPVLDLEEARVLELLFREGEAELRRFVDARLRALIAEDGRRGSDLLQTLAAYLDSGRSPKAAAQALHVHVNTVYYRLERLRGLLGDGFATPARALDLQVALLAHRLVAYDDEQDPVLYPCTKSPGRRLDRESIDVSTARA